MPRCALQGDIPEGGKFGCWQLSDQYELVLQVKTTSPQFSTMGCLSRSVRSAFTFILSILQIAIGLYIIYTVSADLYKVTIETDTSTGKATTNETCFLETEVSTLNLCRLVIAGVSFTFAASFVLSIIQVRPSFAHGACGTPPRRLSYGHFFLRPLGHVLALWEATCFASGAACACWSPAPAASNRA